MAAEIDPIRTFTEELSCKCQNLNRTAPLVGKLATPRLRATSARRALLSSPRSLRICSTVNIRDGNDVASSSAKSQVSLLLRRPLFSKYASCPARTLRDVSEQEPEDFVTAIAKAKNELGSHIARQQVGFKAYPSIDEQNRL
jgi:hypothetical protein